MMVDWGSISLVSIGDWSMGLDDGGLSIDSWGSVYFGNGGNCWGRSVDNSVESVDGISYRN